jgi:hypothetical protein
MATYVPGYKRYEREFEPFTPDFKFLDNVLSIRQDRYNTNYKQMNDLYGKIVYADLSREDSKEIRDQYVNALIPKIEKVSGMDLSVQQNVDAARSLFTPFYDDDLIVRDLVNTSAYKSAMNVAESYKNSDDKELRKKYWSTGVEALQYQMEDFVSADKEAALKIAPPRYVPNADLYNVAQEYLKEQNYKMQWVTGADNKSYYIITGENGERLVPTAYSDLQRALNNDPRIIDAYRTDAYVQSRRYAKQGMDAGKYSNIQDGRVAWAKQTIEDLRLKVANANPILRKQYEDALGSKESWEKYAATRGIVLSDSDVKEVERVQLNFEKTLMNLQNNTDQLERLDAVDENTDYLNLVSSLLMSYNLSSDLFAAAKNYSLSHGGVKSVTANPYTKMRIQHQYDKALEDYKIQKQNENNTLFNQWLQSTFGQEPSTMDEYTINQDAIKDPLKYNAQIRESKKQNTILSQIDFINQFEKLEKGSNYKPNLSIEASDGTIITGTAEELKRKFAETGDYAAVTKAAQGYYQKYDQAMQTEVEKSKNPNYQIDPAWAQLVNQKIMINRGQSQIIQEEEAYGKVLKNTLALLESESNTEHGKTVLQLKEQGVPSPLTASNQFKTLEQFQNDFYNALAAGKMKDSDGDALTTTSSVFAPKMIKDYSAAQPKEGDSYATKVGKYLWAGQAGQAGQIPYTIAGYTTNRDEINKVAEEQYNKYKSVFNLALSGALEQSGGADIYPNYSSDAFFRGIDPENMTSSNLYGGRSYTINWNHATMQDPEVMDIFGDFVRQWRITPDQMKMTSAGKKADKLDDDDIQYKDETAQAIIREVILRTQSVIYDQMGDGKVGQSNQNVNFEITYQQVKNIDDKSYGAYTVSIPMDLLKEFQLKGVNSGTGTINEKDLDAYQTVSFIVDADQDISSRQMGIANTKYVDTEINMSPDNMYEFNDYGQFGGTLKVYKENGEYFGSYTQAVQKEDGSWGYNVIPYSKIVDPETNAPITSNNIDQWVANQQAVLEILHRSNVEQYQN